MQENSIIYARVRNRIIPILVNPDMLDLRKSSRYGDVRFVTDLKTKDTYWWDAHEALHDTIICQLPGMRHIRMGQAKFITGSKEPFVTHQVVRGR